MCQRESRIPALVLVFLGASLALATDAPPLVAEHGLTASPQPATTQVPTVVARRAAATPRRSFEAMFAAWSASAAPSPTVQPEDAKAVIAGRQSPAAVTAAQAREMAAGAASRAECEHRLEVYHCDGAHWGAQVSVSVDGAVVLSGISLDSTGNYTFLAGNGATIATSISGNNVASSYYKLYDGRSYFLGREGTQEDGTAFSHFYGITVYGNCDTTYGACCNDYTGECAYIAREDCFSDDECPAPVRFTPGLACGELETPCGIQGACCSGLECLFTGTESDCDAIGGRFLVGQTCETVACPAECEHHISLYNFVYPHEGWGDNTLDVYVNGILVLESITSPGSYTPFYFNAASGDTITTEFHNNGYGANRCLYFLYDGAANLLARDGSWWSGGPPQGVSVVTNCVPPTTGACCYGAGGCAMVGSAAECIDGEFLGLGASCLGCWAGVVPPEDATPEGEECYAGINEGCTFEEGSFSSIACGETVYGSFGYGGTTNEADWDWYRVMTIEPAVLTWTVAVEDVAYIAIYARGLGACDYNNVQTLAWGIVGASEPESITSLCVPPGEYFMYVFQYNAIGGMVGCPSYYLGTLECTPGCEAATGACCAQPTHDQCVPGVTEAWCVAAGGEWQGAGTTCENSPCVKEYCEAYATICYDPTVNGHISRIQLGTLDNTSGESCYSDFTALETDLPILGEAHLIVTDGNPSPPSPMQCFYEDACAAWIDWNQDEDFEDDGEFLGMLCGGGGTPWEFAFATPSTAVEGPTRLRIRLWWVWDGEDDHANPCGYGEVDSFGEVEDYGVNIVTLPGACCKDDGTGECVILMPQDCAEIPGIYSGPGTVCVGDCNSNGWDDTCDIHAGASADCDLNGIPDECEFVDCNGNGVLDSCDILADTSPDCNHNGIPDECDVANCPAGEMWCADCNANDVPDGCETAAERGHVYQHDDGAAEMELGLGNGGCLAWLNHFVVDAYATRIRYVQIAYGDVAAGTPVTIYLWSDPNQDGDPGDAKVVACASATVVNPNTGILNPVVIPYTNIGPAGTHFFVGAIIAHAAGESPTALDQTTTALQSWLAGGSSIDPNHLSLPQLPVTLVDVAGYPGNWLIRAEATGGDCNGNGIPDDCDVDSDASADCNADAIPDECQLEGNDCNRNGTPDECDVASGVSRDCNDNGIPDECDVNAGTSLDCQGDGIPDECQLWSRSRDVLAWDDGSSESSIGLIAGGELAWIHQFTVDHPGTVSAVAVCFGTPANWGGSGIAAGDIFRVFVWSDPDQDGTPWDASLLAEAWANADGDSIDTDQFQSVPISAQVEGSFFVGVAAVTAAGMHPAPQDDTLPQDHAWVTYNGVPYDPTYWSIDTYNMAAVGIPGNWLLRAEFDAGIPPHDCNSNGVPDECDISAGTSPDCNGNAVPDECDIANGSPDTNGNGVPDECEQCVGDLNCNGQVDFGDINPFVLRLTSPQAYASVYAGCLDANGDVNGNGAVGFDDINPFVALLSGGSLPLMCP